MPQTSQWLLLELGLLALLLVSVVAFSQWRSRRTIEQAMQALSQQIRQSEAERKRTLTGILTGAHHLTASKSAELADSLIRSERLFFRLCFDTLLSQNKNAIERLSQSLYSVLDDYLRKCTPDERRLAPSVDSALKVQSPMPSPAKTAPEDETLLVAAPMPHEEIDWDAAFAEQDNAQAGSGDEEEPMFDQQIEQDTLHHLLSTFDDDAETPAEPTESTAADDTADDENVMADRGAALKEQAATTAKPPPKEDALDLGWDNAFLETEAESRKPPIMSDQQIEQDALRQLLSGLDDEINEETSAEPADDEDIMADSGAALEEQASTTAKPPPKEDAFDLGWDDAFIDTQSDKKTGS